MKNPCSPPAQFRHAPGGDCKTRQSARAVVRTDAKIPVHPGRPFRYCHPSRPGPKTNGLDAWEHCIELGVSVFLGVCAYGGVEIGDSYRFLMG